jgi:hypothetical protein
MRPEDCLIATGAHSLDDADLLSLLMSSRDSNHDLRPHLAGLLARFKGLGGLFSAARSKVAHRPAALPRTPGPGCRLLRSWFGAVWPRSCVSATP